jgi:hypothetical protein
MADAGRPQGLPVLLREAAGRPSRRVRRRHTAQSAPKFAGADSPRKLDNALVTKHIVRHKTEPHGDRMHDENERTLQRGHFLATRVTEDLYLAVSADAARLGCSMADAMRWRLASGHCPVMPTGEHRRG